MKEGSMKKVLCAFALVAVGALSMASTASASTTTCNGTFTGATLGDVVVPDNGACILIASQVNGNVTVKKKAYFESNATNITGSVTSLFSQTVYIHDASTVGQGVNAFLTHQVFLFDSTVSNRSVNVLGTPAWNNGTVNLCGANVQNGNINVLFSGTDVLVGDPLTVGCAGNKANNATIAANFTDVELVVRGNTIKNELEVSYNKGPAAKFVEANIGTSANSEIECNRNSSPFTATANVFVQKEGQCAGP
jgi:hypothetical protein